MLGVPVTTEQMNLGRATALADAEFAVTAQIAIMTEALKHPLLKEKNVLKSHLQ